MIYAKCSPTENVLLNLIFIQSSYLVSITILRTCFSEIDATAISQSTIRSSHVVKDHQNSAVNLTAGTAMVKRHLMNRTGIDIIPFYRYNSKVAVKAKSISIATHMSTEESVRFQRLLDMTSRWNGYISVAIYVKQYESEEENLIKIINSFLDVYSNFFEDKVAIHLVIDRRKSRDSEFYPINFLRNIAMENTMTDLVMNLDIDFIPSLNSHNLLQSHMSDLKNETKVVMILPSFERSLARDEDWKSITSSELPSSKIQLMNEIKKNYRKTKAEKKEVYSPFHLSLFNEGHGPTDFPRWYNASDVYMVRYISDFEPYYLKLSNINTIITKGKDCDEAPILILIYCVRLISSYCDSEVKDMRLLFCK